MSKQGCSPNWNVTWRSIGDSAPASQTEVRITQSIPSLTVITLWGSLFQRHSLTQVTHGASALSSVHGHSRSYIVPSPQPRATAERSSPNPPSAAALSAPWRAKARRRQHHAWSRSTIYKAHMVKRGPDNQRLVQEGAKIRTEFDVSMFSSRSWVFINKKENLRRENLTEKE